MGDLQTPHMSLVAWRWMDRLNIQSRLMIGCKMKHTVILEVERSTESDKQAAKEICGIFIYRPFQIYFAREMTPPDHWTFTFKDCTMAFVDSLSHKVAMTMALHGTKFRIRIVENG